MTNTRDTLPLNVAGTLDIRHLSFHWILGIGNWKLLLCMPLKDQLDLFNLVKEEAFDWFAKEIATLRSGRVKPDLVETLQVEYYGTRSPLNSLASVASSDARTLVVTPYDKNAISDIEKAMIDANLGVQPTVDGDVIRLYFPSLTEDIRQQTLKTLHAKAEETRVRLRQGRDEALRDLKQQKDKGEATEDDWYNGKKQLNEAIDAANKEIDELVKKKEGDIQSV